MSYPDFVLFEGQIALNFTAIILIMVKLKYMAEMLKQFSYLAYGQDLSKLYFITARIACLKLSFMILAKIGLKCC